MLLIVMTPAQCADVVATNDDSYEAYVNPRLVDNLEAPLDLFGNYVVGAHILEDELYFFCNPLLATYPQVDVNPSELFLPPDVGR